MEHPARVALVTGGGRRVGAAIVERFAEAGFSVIFTYLSSAAAANAMASRLAAAGVACAAVRADLADPADGASAVVKAVESFGRLDVLVNNASVYEPSGLQQATAEQLRRFWAVHVEAPMLLCRHFEPHLRRAGGSVVNMVDLLAERPWPEYMGYCASKAALANLTLSLARELAPQVNVNGIAPGVVEWPEGYPEEERHKYLRRVPLGRAGTPRDVAELAYFLCTAGKYITGQIIRLDGGRSLT